MHTSHALRKRVEYLLTQSVRLSVIVVHIVGFDRIGDVSGRTHRDRVLYSLARQLSTAAPAHVTGCIGQGEFLVIAPWTSASQATTGKRAKTPESTMALATRIERAAVDAFAIHGRSNNLRVAVGATVAFADHHRVVDDAIRDAATAARCARLSGRSGAWLFDSEMREALLDPSRAEVHLAKFGDRQALSVSASDTA